MLFFKEHISILKACFWRLGRNGGEVKRKTYLYNYLRRNNPFSRKAELKITRERRDGGKQGKHNFHSWTSTSRPQMALGTELLKDLSGFEHTNSVFSFLILSLPIFDSRHSKDISRPLQKK